MTRDEYRRRAAAGEPIVDARELVHALMELQHDRTVERTLVWFLLNGFIRQCIDEADRFERNG